MRQQIASAVNVVIQVSRLGDGTRKIIQISEIVGMEGDVITMQDIFVFERQGIGENDKVLGAVQGHRHPAQVRRSAQGLRHRSGRHAVLQSRRAAARERAAGREPPMVGLPSSTWITALLVFFAVALGTISVALVVECSRSGSGSGKRSDSFAPSPTTSRTQEGILRLHGDELPRWFQPHRGPRSRACRIVELMMEQAGMKSHVPMFLFSSIGISVGLGLAVLALARWWPAAALAAVIGALVPYSVVRFKRNRRIGAFEEHAARGHRPARPRHPRRASAFVRA